MKTPTNFLTLFLIGLLLGTTQLQAQDTLPFREPPSASTTGKTLADSKHQWRTTESHLPADSPNIVIFMTDDAGFANASTFGGPINTPTLDRLAATGISYNEFHTTAMCSPTRASLLTGRNYHRVGAGQIAELAADWDGYVGKIPKSTTTFAQVLSYYGYNTAAFGKWHNTPVTDITRLGPFDRYPTGMGFDYFYGFLAGETSQYEPALFENTNPIEAPHDPKYHLTEDMAEHAIQWIRTTTTIEPDKPFFVYFTPGAVHGPHQIFKEWIDKYKGRFDEGWEALRTMTFEKQKEMGWIPQDAVLNPLAESMQKWEDVPKSQREFQIRLMEIYAGFLEHTDVQYGKVRSQFHHVNDIAATIYDILDITPPKFVNGVKQQPLDGVSMVYTFDNPEAPTTKKTQYFEIMGSRGIYHEGWFAGVFGPRTPWSTDMSNMMNWNPETDEWELYNLEEDYSQSKNLAKEIPEYAEGVLFALGGISSGFTVYMDKGFLKAEYNAMTLNRYKISSESPVAAGKVKIEVETLYDGPERLAPGNRYSEDQWKTSWTGTH